MRADPMRVADVSRGEHTPSVDVDKFGGAVIFDGYKLVTASKPPMRAGAFDEMHHSRPLISSIMAAKTRTV